MTKECGKEMAKCMTNFFKIYDDFKYFGFNNHIDPKRDQDLFMGAMMEAMNAMMLQVLNDNYEELAD